MAILLIPFLIIIYVFSLICVNIRYLADTSNYSKHIKEIKKPGVKFFIISLEFFSIFFELIFITDILFVVLNITGISFIYAAVIAFIAALFFFELLLKLIVKLMYEGESENGGRGNSLFGLLSPFLFKLSFLILPAEIKKIVKENSRYNAFFAVNKKNYEQDKAKEDEGVIEQEIIDKVFELGDQSVYESMRPRTEIVGVDISASINEVHQIFVDSGYSKLIVYDENVDNIKGVVFAYDLFKSPQDLKSITRDVFFVPENKKSIEMLNLFLNNRISIAVVVDEFGGTAGIVTMEDIIEELFGEIKDEYDIEENICKKVSENSYVFSGKVEIDYINETFELNIPYGDYETVGGLIITNSGRIPLKGEIVRVDDFIFNILRSSNVKIDLVKMIVANKYKN